MKDIDTLSKAEGLDQFNPILQNNIIGSDSLAWQKKMVDGIGQARKSGALYRTPGIGGISLAGGKPIQKNTFFGD